MKQVLKKLNESYPDTSSLRSFFWESLGIGVFIFVFLYFFEPFEIGSIPGNSLLICAGFGLITFVISLLFELFFRFVLKINKEIDSWTLGKWILSTSILISCIAVANHLYLILLFPHGPFSLGNLFFSFVATFAIGIFPIIFAGLFNQLRYVKKNLKQAEEIQVRSNDVWVEPSLILDLPSANKNQTLQVPMEELLFIEAMQNYVLVYLRKEGELKKEIIRTTISKLESSLPEVHFYRCHRSYLVNLNQIESVDGNAQGLKLIIKEQVAPEQAILIVPVSRNKIKELKYRLSQKSSIRP